MKLYVYQIEHAEGEHIFFTANDSASQFSKEAVCIGTIEVSPTRSNDESSSSK